VIPRSTGYLVTIALVAPDSVAEAHVRVLVPPCLLKNTARASNASAATLPSPPGYEGPYWRPRASDIGRYALQAIDMPCHDVSWLRTSERCSGPLADSDFSTIPFEVSACYPLDLPLDLPRPSAEASKDVWRLNGPTMPCAPSWICNCSTFTFDSTLPRCRSKASTCAT